MVCFFFIFREAPKSQHHAISPDLSGWRTAVALPHQLGNGGTKASALPSAPSLLIAGESSRVSGHKVFVFRLGSLEGAL